MRFSRLASLAVAAVAVSASGRAEDVLPLDQVRPGMVGVGRTVFEGTRIDEFVVEIIGVLENVGPKQSIILARLQGGPLATTGVIAGMSGSPVFVDGRLVGAVAYGFPFSKETIAGITPFGEMVDRTRSAPETPRAASARLKPVLGRHGPPAPLDRGALVAALRQPLPSVSVEAGAGVARGPGAASPGALVPLALPLVFRGFAPETFEWARDLFSGLGFVPVQGAAAGSAPPGPLPDLAPGGPVGVSLVEGDLDLTVTGTITHIEQDRVYAFGHPFYNLGPTRFPMRKAYVYSVFPSLYQSWKISVPGEPVGTIEQDRTTAIAGRLGDPPRMIPVTARLRTSRGQERRFAFRIVEDELLSPVLAYVSLASAIQGSERTFGTSTIRLDARIGLTDGREIKVDDVFTERQPAQEAAALAAAPVAYLMTNDFEPVRVDSVDVSIESFETVQTAVLERAWIEPAGPVRPGTHVPLKLLLRTYRGDSRIETIPVSVPAHAPAGPYTLLIADGTTLAAIEQREMQQPFAPRSLDQLIRAINGLRRRHHVYVRLLRRDPGAIVEGEHLQSLPPSILSVLRASGGPASVVPLGTASVWEFDLPTDHAVSGSRTLSLDIQR